MAAAVAQVGVGKLVGDDPADEILRAAAERALEDDAAAGPAGGGGAERDVGGEERGLVVADEEGRVGHEVALDVLRQGGEDGGDVLAQERLEREGGEPGVVGRMP